MRGKKLADAMTELAGDGKEALLDFASCMLQRLFEKTKTAKDLLQHRTRFVKIAGRFFNNIDEKHRYS